MDRSGSLGTMGRLVLLCGLICAGAALAQESTGFVLRESSFNSGGHPQEGVVLASASFEISLASLGDNVVAHALSSDSFHVAGGFAGAYPPPGMVEGLRFETQGRLDWDAEKSAGTYNLYRGLQSELLGLDFGECEQQELSSPTTMDTDAVPPGDGYFYLVTVENLLDEEGSKGFQSDGTERQGATCP
jgi:hypothetical protein